MFLSMYFSTVRLKMVCIQAETLSKKEKQLFLNKVVLDWPATVIWALSSFIFASYLISIVIGDRTLHVHISLNF